MKGGKRTAFLAVGLGIPLSLALSVALSDPVVAVLVKENGAIGIAVAFLYKNQREIKDELDSLDASGD